MASGGRALMAMVVLLGLLHNAAAETYLVGQSSSNGDSWTYVTGNQASYDSQFTSINLVVGDVLSFVFTASHDVDEVPPADVATCVSSNAISEHATSTNITLATAGQHGFICTIPGHCSSSGMHLLVTVAASAPATSPSVAPATTPTSAPATTPTSAPATTPTSAPATTPSSAPATSPTSAPGTSPTSAPSTTPEGPASPPGPNDNASFKLKSTPAILLGSLLAAVLVL